MKKFKNDICVRGSSALCKAFASELKAIGYTFNAEQDNPICVVTYGGKNTNLLTHWNTSLGVNPIQLILPQNWDKALALASEIVEPEIIKDKPITYKRGNKFSNGGDEYIIARESANHRSLILVNLTDGNIWNNAVEVNNPNIITEKEFQLLSGGGRFKLIK